MDPNTEFDGDRFFTVFNSISMEDTDYAHRLACAHFIAQNMPALRTVVVNKFKIRITLRVVKGTKQIQREQKTIAMAEWYRILQNMTSAQGYLAAVSDRLRAMEPAVAATSLS